MFDEVTLITITQTKNKNGEYIETETRLDVPVVMQRVTREQRDKYNERGAGRALRFKVQLYGNGYNQDNTPYFIHENVKYSVTDFTKDTTGTSYFIEGTSARGKR